MKGISTIIVMVLLLLIGISLTSLGYVTFTSLFSQITQSTEGSISQTVTTMLAQMKIDSIKVNVPPTADIVYIRNIGKVTLNNINLYVNDVRDTSTLATLAPGNVGQITAVINIQSGDVIKVTTAEGAIAMQSAP